jgi:flagellar biosynthesis protein FlhF
MGFRKYLAPSAREAMERIRKELGAEALILSNRRLESGRVEIIAAAPNQMRALVDDLSEAAPQPKPQPQRVAVRAGKEREPSRPAQAKRVAPESFQEFIRRQSSPSIPRFEGIDMYDAVARETDIDPGLTASGITPDAAERAPRTGARSSAASEPAPRAAMRTPAPIPEPAVFRRRPSRLSAPVADETAMARALPETAKVRSAVARSPETQAPRPQAAARMPAMPRGVPSVTAPAAPIRESAPVATAVITVPTAAAPVAVAAPAAVAMPIPAEAPSPVIAAAAAVAAAPAPQAAAQAIVTVEAAAPGAGAPVPATPAPATETVVVQGSARAAPAPSHLASATPSSSAPPAPPAGESRVMAELQNLRSVLSDRITQLEAHLAPVATPPARAGNPLGHAGRRQVMTRMLMSGFSPDLSRRCAEAAPAGLDPKKSDQWLQQLLAQQIRCPGDGDNPLLVPGAVALVGPTGVGKTTTIAKLAARFVVRHGAGALGLVTLDSYRIGAHEQLRSYGRILGVPVQSAHDAASLAELLRSLHGKRQVLIDTCGLSQRDPRLGEMLSLLSQARFGDRDVQRILLINAASHAETVDEVARAWRVDRAHGTVLTKIDEAARIGGALDALVRYRLALLGLTNGQRVPEDWHPGNPGLLAHIALKPLGAAFAFDSHELSNLAAAGPLAA